MVLEANMYVQRQWSFPGLTLHKGTVATDGHIRKSIQRPKYFQGRKGLGLTAAFRPSKLREVICCETSRMTSVNICNMMKCPGTYADAT